MESVQKVYGFDITDDDYNNSNSDLIMSQDIIDDYLRTPRNKQELIKLTRALFRKGIYDFNSIDVSNITDFSYVFKDYEVSFIDISKWDVSNGVNFSHMFENSSIVGIKDGGNDLSKWDVRNGKDFSYMFSGCKRYCNLQYHDMQEYGDIGCWNVRNGENFEGMFSGCPRIMYDLGLWVDKIDYEHANIQNMFYGLWND